MAELYDASIDELVTGEAVSLDLPPGPLGLHAVSAFVDVIVSIIVLVAGIWFTALLASDAALFSVGVTVTAVLAFLVVPTAVETLSRGRSLGKLITGLRTVRDDAGPISFMHAFVRALLGLAEIWLLYGVPAFICGLVSRKGKRIGDYVAGTYVVRARVKLTLPPPALMPPPLAGWARAADIAPLPERLMLSVRQVLGRADTLAPQTRQALLDRLALEISAYVAPPPPVGTPADAYLAAVISEHRDRDLARMQREAALVDRLTAAARQRV
ncbi:RDD family protein [Nocardioides marmorisolisilvae]|uniref:RDD family protein n=1 Tax=Nocardioides marmorisolisilvae TaxID=1542737 RepID=A0A3N0DZV1_9ACTN|nr:RDD family protein [Nocardioides marmorisolisilvae]RNL81036.1 RDD family protein [Nocardioides marmorisolisilvae]